MVNRREYKKYACLLDYFLFYATIIAYCSLTSCFGVRPELIPKINQMFVQLSEQAQENYRKLFEILNDDDDEKKQMEQTIKRIKGSNDLENFIQKNIEIHQNYNDIKELLNLLTEREKKDFQQQWKQYNNIKDIDNQINYKKEIIAQYESKLKLIKDAPTPIRQYCIDLVKVLPEAESVAFQNDIVHAGSLDRVNALIASKLPDAFKQLDEGTKENLSKLPDDTRQKIFGELMNKKLLPSYEEATGITPPPYGTTTVATLPSGKVLDIKKLIEKEIQDQQDQDDAIPQDGWGEKLPLRDENRNDFLTLIARFDLSDQQSLKEFFDEADEISIYNIAFILYTRFTRDQRIKLISAIIYLYKGWRSMTIKLCNHPKEFNFFDKLKLLGRAEKEQVQLLTQLDKYLG